MAQPITRLQQLTSVFNNSPRSLVVVLFAEEQGLNSDIRVEMQNCMKSFQQIAMNMNQLPTSQPPIHCYVNYPYSSSDDGAVQQFCGASSIPFVAICSTNGVVKTWPGVNVNKITKHVREHLGLRS